MRRLSDEDGAAAVMIGLMLIVLFGFGAIAIDVGAMFTERRELQNGADAAVLAVAQNCAAGDAEPACDVGPQGDRLATARTFANSNARDGSAAVADDGVTVDYAAARATVTATSLNNGEGFVRHWFTGFLPSAPEATEVAATSTAIWGPLSFGSIGTLPLTFSQCEYNEFLAVGAGSANEPWTTANNGDPSLIYFHQNDAADDCNITPPGFDLPGGFGWLKTDGSGCEANIDAEGWIEDKTGNTPSSGCSAAWMKANVFQNVIFLPVYQNTNGLNGNNGEYYIGSYAAFYVTGYNFGGQYKEGLFSDPPCSGNDRCIEGWFTTGAVLDGVVDPSAPDNGVRTVQFVQN
jgi:Flp pilus assembly protein TadG